MNNNMGNSKSEEEKKEVKIILKKPTAIESCKVEKGKDNEIIKILEKHTDLDTANLIHSYTKKKYIMVTENMYATMNHKDYPQDCYDIHIMPPRWVFGFNEPWPSCK